IINRTSSAERKKVALNSFGLRLHFAEHAPWSAYQFVFGHKVPVVCCILASVLPETLCRIELG
ncbi:MAG: hypothetical protein V2A58_15575, partial [Planctomycetota bacterium]